MSREGDGEVGSGGVGRREKGNWKISRTCRDDAQSRQREHLTYAMSINAYVRQKLEHLQLDHKEK